MAERINVGLIYSYNKDWVAGAYYIQNLIYALNTLPDDEKPMITVLSYALEDFGSLQSIGYPYLRFRQLYEKDLWASYSLPERLLNKVSRLFLKKNIFYREHTKKRLQEKVDLLFPASNRIYFSAVKCPLYWIPDFQEFFLPHFFSTQELNDRKAFQTEIAERGDAIVFSSADALAHFRQIYPGSSSPVFTLPFAVTHPDFRKLDLTDLLNKYDIERPFFFCANQFWAHKNHVVLLQAIKLLRDSGTTGFSVAFSGKQSDYRNPDFFKGIVDYIETHGLAAHVRFLGFIDRAEQLKLMDNAVSVIQPSLFEGWSTVVEDAKAMGQHVILSDLPVHREQLDQNVSFFSPQNAEELAGLMRKYLSQLPLRSPVDYEKQIQDFGKKFMKIVHSISRRDTVPQEQTDL